MLEKRGAIQDVLRGTSEEVRPKASKVEDAEDLEKLTPTNRRNTLKVRYKKLNALTSPTKEV